FIYFKPINFPVFNFADICVFCGAVMFIIYILFLEPKATKKQSSNIKED
ncbi:MAG: signal peptidase II, partial [Oscillospiraceae bacterium]|nr:signal peptidase II [Oscillospiraceae bacterium]